MLPLLRLIDANDGSHAITNAMRHRVRRALEVAVQSSWLVHSTDGRTAPAIGSPIDGCASPRHVRRAHIDPIFFHRADAEQRSARVALKAHQFRQILTLALGIGLKGARLQCVRNEGGLSLRVSSASDILTKSNQERTAKSISPTQTDADEGAFGDRHAKRKGAKAQRLAWDDNSLILSHIFTSISPPQSHEGRWRGDAVRAEKAKLSAMRLRRDNQILDEREAFSRELLKQASGNMEFLKTTHSAIRQFRVIEL